ncbi:MAG: FimV/HubP family polar landmark protein, partial [Algiphilus sp.]
SRDDNALDFDWALPEEDAAATGDQPESGLSAGMAQASDDFGRDAIASDSSPERAESAPGTRTNTEDGDAFAAVELDADSFDLDDFSLDDFDLDAGGEATSAEVDSGGAPDVPMLELPEEDTAPAAADVDADDAFSLDDFEIDPNAESAPSASGAEQELAGQLDLARAYVDMGEGDMARPLLEMVQQGGDATQREEAQRLLDIVG